MAETATLERQERYIKLKGGWVFYLEQGSGPPLLLLHAAGGSSWVWRKVIDELAENFMVYAPDLPGFDRSETPDHFYKIEEFTDDFIQFLAEKGIERTSVIGNLTGAMIALDMATRRPELVERLILVSCPGWTMEEGKIVYDRFFTPWYDENHLPRQVPYVEGSGKDREQSNFSNSILARNGLWFAKVHEVNTTFDILGRIGKLQCPTLLIYGETCPQLRREEKMRTGIPGGKSVIIPGAGSSSFQEQPEAFLNAAIPFLKGE
jgi:pimeloyl-ACP methyl ester carboxylesterase